MNGYEVVTSRMFFASKTDLTHHDVEVWIVGVLIRPSPQTPFLFVRVDNFADVLLHELALHNLPESDETPAFALLPHRLTLLEFALSDHAIAALGTYPAIASGLSFACGRVSVTFHI